MAMARPGASKVLSALGTISSSFFSSGACPRTRSGTNRATSAVSSHRFTASPSVDQYHESHVTSPEVNVNQACVLPRSPAKVILELRNVDNADVRAGQPPGQLLWKIPDRNALPLDPSLPLHFAKAVEIGPKLSAPAPQSRRPAFRNNRPARRNGPNPNRT